MENGVFTRIRNKHIIVSCYIDNTNMLTDRLKNGGSSSFLSYFSVNNPTLLEISGFNPLMFGKEPITSIPAVAAIDQLHERPVAFGSYTYPEEGLDEKSVAEAAAGTAVFRYTIVNHRSIIKSFVPIGGEVPYVIGLVFDRQPLINQMNEQRNKQIYISMILLVIVVFCSYWLSDILLRPVRSILWKVNEVSFWEIR